jgi:hypothetical protein
MLTWGMQYSLTSTEDTAAQMCPFVHEGQQQETARDSQPKGTHHLPTENCYAIHLRLSNAMEHNSFSVGENIFEVSLSFSQKPATGLYGERHEHSSV